MNTMTKLTVIFTLALSTHAMGASINERQDNQQARIKQGIISGEITNKEGIKLTRQQIKTQRKEARFKADGNFTKKERAIVQRDLTKNSASIYKQKHDKQTRF
tara:strand:+ start:325 stop:633 length:309 start_codon:yes stop_codon:yes gene_type:complete